MFTPFTRWFPVTGISVIKAVVRVHNATGQALAQPAIEYAEIRTDEPGSWSALGSQSAATQFASITVTSSAQFWARLGVATRLSNSTIGLIDVTLHAAMVQEGAVLDTKTLTINPDINSSQTGYHPVTGWLPACGLSKLKAAFVVMGLTGTLSYQLAWRLAATDQMAPGSWNLLGTQQTPGTANSEYLQVDQTVAPGSNMWYQVGVAVSGTNPAATIHVAVAAVAG